MIPLLNTYGDTVVIIGPREQMSSVHRIDCMQGTTRGRSANWLSGSRGNLGMASSAANTLCCYKENERLPKL